MYLLNDFIYNADNRAKVLLAFDRYIEELKYVC